MLRLRTESFLGASFCALAILLALAAHTDALVAQNPPAAGLCWRSSPALCSITIITSAGASASIPFGEYAPYDEAPSAFVRAVADWGILARLTPRDALGVTYVIS